MAGRITKKSYDPVSLPPHDLYPGGYARAPGTEIKCIHQARKGRFQNQVGPVESGIGMLEVTDLKSSHQCLVSRGNVDRPCHLPRINDNHNLGTCVRTLASPAQSERKGDS